jgi:hypothetical protein
LIDDGLQLLFMCLGFAGNFLSCQFCCGYACLGSTDTGNRFVELGFDFGELTAQRPFLCSQALNG